MTGFDLVAHGINHASVLEVEEAPAGGGKGKSGKTGVPKDKELHLPPEGRRYPFVIFAVHCLYCNELAITGIRRAEALRKGAFSAILRCWAVSVLS